MAEAPQLRSACRQRETRYESGIECSRTTDCALDDFDLCLLGRLAPNLTLHRVPQPNVTERIAVRGVGAVIFYH